MSGQLNKLRQLQRIHAALGPYEFTSLVAEFIHFMLQNRYEGVILIDPEGRVAFMDRLSERFFGLAPGGGKDMLFTEIVPSSPLPDVAKTGVPQIWQVQEVRGKKKIVSRLPLFKDGKLIGATARVITHELEEIENLSRTVKRLKAKISDYKRGFLAENRAHYTFDDILGISTTMVRTRERAKRLALTDSTILISGESGTGKELFGHAIHQASPRSKGPFIRVNCAAIPFNLAESELFGYVKGAFTGSNSGGQKGKFELAAGGTIFLDEISSMPLGIQAMVLRVIQEREIQPLGSSVTRKVDFRLIAATNVNLENQVRNGSFRGDLYYRLSAVPCNLSPLRERPEDVSFLANSLLEGINRKLKGNVGSIRADALEVLIHYDWPGNVRELINALEQAVLNANQAEEIDAAALPEFLRNEDHPRRMIAGPIRDMVARAERKAVLDALETVKGNKRRAANILGISRAALYQKLHRYELFD
ncbi:MAG: sigma 54-interacting transcriptional regulator [Deltaproteobacteria bacterium]|nr:sigma 54-interacting transcriptional regulator [Deltaproteobacteria bacterium]